jgi:hypothetical protein
VGTVADKLREINIHLVDGVQTATIVDVLVYDGDIHLLLQGKRERLHVVKVRPSGVVIVPPSTATIIEALHAEEVAEWLATQSPDPGNS